jgi:transposase
MMQDGGEALRRARLEACDLFVEGHSCAEVARRLGFARQTVSRWHQRWEAEGAEALSDVNVGGRKRRLTEEQLKGVVEELLKGPQAHGYETQYWTLARIAALIEAKTGVRYSITHVWRLLRRVKWTCQKPERRAKERNEKEIARWREEEWPRIKRGR